eukprot:1162090-Pelagomonas_calceolata.AAC.20
MCRQWQHSQRKGKTTPAKRLCALRKGTSTCPSTRSDTGKCWKLELLAPCSGLERYKNKIRVGEPGPAPCMKERFLYWKGYKGGWPTTRESG